MVYKEINRVVYTRCNIAGCCNDAPPEMAPVTILSCQLSAWHRPKSYNQTTRGRWYRQGNSLRYILLCHGDIVPSVNISAIFDTPTPCCGINYLCRPSRPDIGKTFGPLLDRRTGNHVENPSFTDLPKVLQDLIYFNVRFPIEGLPIGIFFTGQEDLHNKVVHWSCTVFTGQGPRTSGFPDDCTVVPV